MPDSFASSEGLTKLAQHISGYTGYEKSEARSNSDTEIRNLLIDRIKELLALFAGDFDAAGEKEKTALAKRIDSTQRKLKIICDSLKAPTYLHGQFFLAGDVNNHRLERIYKIEWEMLEELVNIKEELTTFRSSLSEEIIKDHFLQISNFVDDLNQLLFEREALIIGDA
jgi:hypothetical protein